MYFETLPCQLLVLCLFFWVCRLRCACSRCGTSHGRALQPFSNRSVNSKVALCYMLHHHCINCVCCCFCLEKININIKHMHFFSTCHGLKNNLKSADGIQITNMHSNNRSDCLCIYLFFQSGRCF